MRSPLSAASPDRHGRRGSRVSARVQPARGGPGCLKPRRGRGSGGSRCSTREAGPEAPPPLSPPTRGPAVTPGGRSQGAPVLLGSCRTPRESGPRKDRVGPVRAGLQGARAARSGSGSAPPDRRRREDLRAATSASVALLPPLHLLPPPRSAVLRSGLSGCLLSPPLGLRSAGRQLGSRPARLRTAAKGRAGLASARAFADAPRQLPPQRQLQWFKPAGLFFLSSELAVLLLSRRDLARCCRATDRFPSGAWYPRRCWTAARLGLLRVMPGAFLSCPQVLPGLRARSEACSELQPAATPALTPGPSLGGSGISSAAFEAVNSPARQP
ncbi:uncharacterized protein WM277_012177 isoform 1-T5 [Molossus nigricans]